MAVLKAERNETQQARDERQRRTAEVDAVPTSDRQAGNKKDVVLTPAQEMKKRKLDERRALIEAKRIKVRHGFCQPGCAVRSRT